MKTNTDYDSCLAKARIHEPFGGPTSFGFETRLRSAIAERIPSELEEMGRFSWRFTFASLPLLGCVSLFLGLNHSGFFPEGLGGVLSQWSLYLPIDLL